MKSPFLKSFRIEPNLRKVLSVGIAFGVLGVIIAVPAVMLDGYLQRRDDIKGLTAETRRLVERIGGLNAEPPSDLPTNDNLVDILASDQEAAAAHLQATLRGLGTTLGTTEIKVDSMRALPTLPEGNFIAVRASASITAPGPRAFDVINTLEAATPPIGIDSIRIVSRVDASGARGNGQPMSATSWAELTIALRVYARSGPAVTVPLKPAGRRASRVGGLP